MPELCRFYGIIVYMFFNDHNPPHFKVSYGEFEANILIEDGGLLTDLTHIYQQPKQGFLSNT